MASVEPALVASRSAGVTPRVLILTASVGEGHDLPARMLAAQLRAEHGDVEIVTADALLAMGTLVRAVSADAAALVFYRFQWVWDLGFWLFTGPRATRAATQALLARSGTPGLLRLIDEVRPDVVVSTYPNVHGGARSTPPGGPAPRPWRSRPRRRPRRDRAASAPRSPASR